MSFKSYAVAPLADGTFLFSKPEPVRFSGSHGLIAKYTAMLPAADSDGRWMLTIEDCLRLMGTLPSTEERWIVFEQTEDDRLRLSRLASVKGSVVAYSTELLLTLSPLTVLTPPPRLTAEVPTNARTWCEQLALDGAPGRQGASWRWCDRPLHIGAAVLGAPAHA